jgi:hypothetical protein
MLALTLLWGIRHMSRISAISPGNRMPDAPAYVSRRQHTSAYVSIRRRMSAISPGNRMPDAPAYVSRRQHTSAYVSIRRRMSAVSAGNRMPDAPALIHLSVFVRLY